MPSFLTRLRHLETVAGETPRAGYGRRRFARLAAQDNQGSHVRRRRSILMNVHGWGSRDRGASQTPQTSVSPREQPIEALQLASDSTQSPKSAGLALEGVVTPRRGRARG